MEAQKQALFYRVCRQKIEQDWRKIMLQPEASTDPILVLGMLEAAALPLDDAFIIGLSASLCDFKVEGIDYKTSLPMTSAERLVTLQLILYTMALGQILGLTEAEMAQQKRLK